MRADEATESSDKRLRFRTIKSETHVTIPALDDDGFSGKHGTFDLGEFPQQLSDGRVHGFNLSDNQSDVKSVAVSPEVLLPAACRSLHTTVVPLWSQDSLRGRDA